MPARNTDEGRWKEDSRIEFVPEMRGYYALGIIEVIYIGTNPPKLCSTTIRERLRSHFTNRDQQRLSKYLSSLDSWENIRIWSYETPRPCIEEKRLVNEYKIIHDGYMPEFNELRVWNPSKCHDCSSIPPTPMAPHLTTWQWKRVPQSEASTDGTVKYETLDPRRISNKKGIYAVGRIILFESELTENIKRTMQEHLAGLPGSIVRIWWRTATLERPLQMVIQRMTDSRHSLRVSSVSLNSNKSGTNKNGMRRSAARPQDQLLTMSRSSSVSSVERKRQNSLPERQKGGRVIPPSDDQLRGRQNSLPVRQRGRRAQRATSETRVKESKPDIVHELDVEQKRERSSSETRDKPSVSASVAESVQTRHSSTKTESEESDGGRPSLSHLVMADIETLNVASLLRPHSGEVVTETKEPVPDVHYREGFISELKNAQRRILGSSVVDAYQDEVFDRPSTLHVDDEKPSTSLGSPVSDVPPPLPVKGIKANPPPMNVLPLPARSRNNVENGPKIDELPEVTRDRKPHADGRPDSMRDLKPGKKSVQNSVQSKNERNELASPVKLHGHKSDENDLKKGRMDNSVPVSGKPAASVGGRMLLRQKELVDPPESKRLENIKRPATPDSFQSEKRPETPDSKYSDQSSKKSGKAKKAKSNKHDAGKGKQKPDPAQPNGKRSTSVQQGRNKRPVDTQSERSADSEPRLAERHTVQYRSKKTGKLETVDITDVRYRARRRLLERRDNEKRAIERKAALKREEADRRDAEKREAIEKREAEKRQAQEKKDIAQREAELRKQRKASVKKPKNSPAALPQNEGYELKSTRSDKGCIIS